MKKILVLLSITLIAFTVQSQIMGQGKYKDYYLLSDPFYYGCAGLENERCRAMISNTNLVAYSLEVAQKFHSDTLLTVVGVAWMGDFSVEARKDYMAIADTDFTVERRVKMKRIDNYLKLSDGSSAYNIYKYSELFFDTAINVKGDFILRTDMAKGLPYDQEIYGNFAYTIGGGLFQIMIEPNCIYPADVYYRHFGNEKKPKTETLPAHCEVSFMEDWQKMDTVPAWSYGSAGEFSEMRDDEGICIAYLPTAFYWFPIFSEEVDYTVSCIGCNYDEDYPEGYPPQDTTVVIDTTAGDDTVGLGTALLDRYTNVFPSPAKEDVFVQSSFKIKEVEIINSVGQVMERVQVDGYYTTLDVRNYPKGTYFVKITTKTKSITKKIVIQ